MRIEIKINVVKLSDIVIDCYVINLKFYFN